MERLVSALAWLGLLAVAFLAAPPPAPDTGALIMKMVTGQLDGVNRSLFALFNLMGVYPMAFVAVLALDSPAQRVPKWPFVLGSFALGAFALLPYLALRRWNAPRLEPATWWQRLVSGRAFGAVLAVAALGLMALFLAGDLTTFTSLVTTQQFPFVMSFDFVACWLSGALLSREEATLRGQPGLRWVGLVPALGLPLVLALRRVHSAGR